MFGMKGTRKYENTSIWELWKLSDMQEKVWPERRWAPEHHKSHERYGTPDRVSGLFRRSHTQLCASERSHGCNVRNEPRG